MIFSMTRFAATMLAFGGLVVGGGSVATAGSSAGKCQPGHHDACVSAAAPALPGGEAGHLVATAMHRSARPRIVVHARPPYPAEEPGAIYGYAPGHYELGPSGVLYGPYPLNPNAPVAELRY
jgi:hypothetical protein